MAYEDPPSLQHDDPPYGPPRPPARLEEDLDLFQTLINQSNDAILIVDPETGLILYINHKACSNLQTHSKPIGSGPAD